MGTGAANSFSASRRRCKAGKEAIPDHPGVSGPKVNPRHRRAAPDTEPQAYGLHKVGGIAANLGGTAE